MNTSKLNSYEKNAELTVYSKNQYVMSMNDYGDLCTKLATASMDSDVYQTVAGVAGQSLVSKGSYKETVFKAAGITISSDGLPLATAGKIEVSTHGNKIATTINDTTTYTTMLKADQQVVASAQAAITKEAAPARMTFRPSAVRYELGKDDMEKLSSTLTNLYNPDGIYRLTSSNKDDSTVGHITNDQLFDLMECKRLASGNATMRDKAISVFKLANGFTIKIGSTYLLVATEAAPKYRVKEPVLFTVIHPDGNGQMFKGTIGQSLGYDQGLQDFAYTVTGDDGVSKSVAEKFLMPVIPDPNLGTEVSTSHF